ncbi:MAG: hypothetical protein WBD63_03030 [Phycisphaerae bacterium]|nr:hypothetical protein [Phycisphaerae bacterium]
MAEFPRTAIENLSVSRLIMGVNWWLAYSHTSQAKDRQICEWATRERLTGIMETFLRAGVDTILGIRSDLKFEAAMNDAEDRVGRRIESPGSMNAAWSWFPMIVRSNPITRSRHAFGSGP